MLKDEKGKRHREEGGKNNPRRTGTEKKIGKKEKE